MQFIPDTFETKPMTRDEAKAIAFEAGLTYGQGPTTLGAMLPALPTDAVDEVPPKQSTIEVDNAIQTWANAAGELSVAKKIEGDLRWSVAKLCFPNPKVGMNSLSLGNGFQFKMKFGYNYTLDKTKLAEVHEKILELGDDAVKMAAPCITWKPELNQSAYNALPEGPVKELMRSIVTTTVAMPALEVVTPNSKKD